MKKLIFISILFIIGCEETGIETKQKINKFSVISRKYPNSGKIQSINTYEVISQTDINDSLIIDIPKNTNRAVWKEASNTIESACRKL